MRVTTAFNKMLRLQGAWVRGVSFAPEGIVVRVALRRRRRVCSDCGQTGQRLRVHARRRVRWRALDLGSQRCLIEAELRRLDCPDCGVRYEAVPFARAGASHTRDFEDTVAYLAQQMARTPLLRLMRVGWEAVGRIIERVVADHLDERRLEGLVVIGVDELAYRKHQRYLTCVADHVRGGIVWVGEGRSAASLQEFFDELGDHKTTICAVSIDMSAAYAKAIRSALPDAEVCFDPFHVVALASKAVDQVRRSEWNAKGKSKTGDGRWVKGARWALLKAPEKLSARQQAKLAEVQEHNKGLYRAYLLKEQLRGLYYLARPEQAEPYLDAWLAWASRSKLRPFVKLARTIREHRDGVLAATRLGLSNGRLEGLNTKTRTITHRSYGFHSAAPLISLIYLCCSGIQIELPLC